MAAPLYKIRGGYSPHTIGERESNGVVRQRFRTGKYTPKELTQLLDKPGQLKEVKKRYDIIAKEELEPCVLRCKGCSALLSAVNPRRQPNSITAPAATLLRMMSTAYAYVIDC
eukprot:1143558-Pelagomonas_calceolata.AAC.1